ncbi:hypothetical protein DE4576_05365 [Mycobacterium marinum]|uniref:YbaB/EbfC family nucleoid-associated protein n=1 Tax=Mycobacterium marinum TaxID=1781 RepID=UPI000E3E2FCE|nr:YbaB/EbfC family nucleoid-associated protein [Mycobacterium marinum]RFZ61961.1 hypothetical protein DE4576_05365 [Mycobacterium marinum]
MNLDPTAAHLLAGLTQFHTALQNRFHQMNAGNFKASDNTHTVQVTLNGYNWLTGIRIQDGLLKQLGSQGVAHRVNQALHNAKQAVHAYDNAANHTLATTLATLSAAINQTHP